MISFDPQEAQAVLIGASVFPRDGGKLRSLPSVRLGIRDLWRVLENPDIIGIPHNNIHPVVDEAHPHGVVEKVAQTAKDAKDILIVYYAGHGLIGGFGPGLLLAVRDTTDAEKEFNAIRFDEIKNAISISPATKKLLILDCCFSGRALETGMSSPGSFVQANVSSIKGACSITSAASNELAAAPKGEKYTAFTGCLIRILEHGIKSQGEGLTVLSIFDALREQLTNDGFPEPQISNRQDGGNIVLARNRYGKSDEQRQEQVEKLAEEIERISNVANDYSEKLAGMEASFEKLRNAVTKTITEKDAEIVELAARVSNLAKSVEGIQIESSNGHEAARNRLEESRLRERQRIVMLNTAFYSLVLVFPALVYGIPTVLASRNTDRLWEPEVMGYSLLMPLIGVECGVIIGSFLVMTFGVRRFRDFADKEDHKGHFLSPFVRALCDIPPRDCKPKAVLASAVLGLAALLGLVSYLRFLYPVISQ